MNWGVKVRRYPDFYERRAGNPRYRRRPEQAELTAYRSVAAVCTLVEQRTEPRFPVAQRRRIVLATNVAETSLTVPGIKYVIDHGTARISRYSYRTKVQRLPIEPISQASANQRKGRCGRVSEGFAFVCIRKMTFCHVGIYRPEILRTNRRRLFCR